MSGFTLGGDDGTTLGGDTGGTLGTQPDAYLLDGQPVGRVTEEIVTATTIELTCRVTSDELLAALRQAKPDEGKVSINPTDDGGHVAIDRADGGNTFRLSFPPRREPLRAEQSVHIRRYEETLVSQSVGEWDVELECVKAGDRDSAVAINETPASDEWGLTTQYGEIATDRVDARFLGTGRNGVERYELNMRLTFDQAYAWEMALARQQGVRVRRIPDGTNQAIDDTSGSVNTLTVTTPTGQSAVTDDDYVVMGWTSRRLNDAFQNVTATIAVEG